MRPIGSKAAAARGIRGARMSLAGNLNFVDALPFIAAAIVECSASPGNDFVIALAAIALQSRRGDTYADIMDRAAEALEAAAAAEDVIR
jgi:uncharacterized protein (DUF2237 family)